MHPRLSWEMLTLNLRNPFRLSYGTSDTRNVFILRLADDAGLGESAIPPYYGVDPNAMIATWQQAAEKTLPFPNEPDAVAAWVGTDGPAPARCALELALYDRIARQRGLPLHALLDLPAPHPVNTSFTIAIDTPDAMARMARQIAAYPNIKIKLGSEDDVARVRAIREARPDAHLRVDANAGWQLDEAIRNVQALQEFDLELIEQPLPKEQIAEMGVVQKNCAIPVVADESVQSMADVERLAQAGVQGLNLKLMKLGGITPALAILRRARQLGLRVMLGQMIETSLGTTAMAHLISLAEWVDLDTPLLITNDPFDGVQYDEHAGITLPTRPGIGAVHK